jgi:hypothetical protein
MTFASLNSRTLNNDTINSASEVFPPVDISLICLGEFNAAPVNSYELDGCRFYNNITSQTILRLAQLVSEAVGDTVITFVQDVRLQVAISGTVIEYAQEVQSSVASYDAIKFTQLVTNAASFLSVYGWDAAISINNVEIPKDRLSGVVIINKESNQNTLCEFKVRVAEPLDFIEFIDGGAVVVNYFDNTGGHRLFTGTVDLPQVDLINKWITVKCSDRREELIKAKLSPLLPTIGRYSKAVQGEITSVGQEMEYRLQTVPSDVDFDSYNTPNINSWYAKPTADYVFSNSDVYYRDPSITWQSRGSIVNDITVTVKYQYQRLYHYQRNFSWTTPDDVLQYGFDGSYTDINGDSVGSTAFYRFDGGPVSHATVGMVQAAIDQAGWKDGGSLTYTDDYLDFGYEGPTVISFGGTSFNLLNDDIGSIVAPSTTPGITQTLLYAIPPSTKEATRILSASWSASTRFAQTIEEQYTLTVKSTQSMNQYGDLTAFANYEVQEDYDVGEWENYKAITARPSGAVVSGDSYYLDKDLDPAMKNLAVLTGIDKAKTQIVASHRDTIVSLQVPIKPNLELRHTIEIDTTPITCKGKVTKITHMLNIPERKGHSTEIEVALFRSNGSGTTTASTVPAKPTDVVSIPSGNVVLGNHMGLDIDNTSGSSSWNGYVGNTTGQLTQDQLDVVPLSDFSNAIKFPVKTTFPEKFIVDTPAIPEALRKLRPLVASATYEVAIPDDDLDIIF